MEVVVRFALLFGLGLIPGVLSDSAYAQGESDPVNAEGQLGIGLPVDIEVTVGGETGVLTFVENAEGDAIYQGDIVLGRAADLAGTRNLRISPQSAGSVDLFGLVIKDPDSRWPGGTLRYRIDPNLPRQFRVRNAIAHWESETEIRFDEIGVPNGDFVTFIGGSGCSSAVGRKGGEQFIRLADGCEFGQTVHEIGHALGLHHEQARADRDTQIRVIEVNIVARRAFNFRRDPFRYQDVGPYCFESIMHYGAFAFSRVPGVLRTIETLGGQSIGQRQQLAECDKVTVTTVYQEEFSSR